MTNNDILRRLRYTFDYNDTKVMSIFELAGHSATREEISDFLKKEDDPAYKNCSDAVFAKFLNGMITHHRGKREGPPPASETKLTNNIIFRKLKIALDLKAEDVLEILALADTKISKHELSAFFRKSGHKHYRECKDQVLRNFLKGAQMHYRDGESPEPDAEGEEKKGFSWE